jgi:hypothetical protein
MDFILHFIPGALNSAWHIKWGAVTKLFAYRVLAGGNVFQAQSKGFSSGKIDHLLHSKY